MKTTLGFHGAARTVTGSKYLVSRGTGRLLVDAGLFQGLRALRKLNWEDPPFHAHQLDRIVAEEGIERLPGAHCYQFFAGEESFAQMADDEPGTFYLTDFLVRHFNRLVVRSLGLDRHPELRDAYFGNYKRVVYLSQTADEALVRAAKDAAKFLGLGYEQVHTGYGDLEQSLLRKFG